MSKPTYTLPITGDAPNKSVSAAQHESAVESFAFDVARLSGGNGVLQLENSDFDSNGRMTLTEGDLLYRVIAFPQEVSGARRVVRIPEGFGWTGIIVPPETNISTRCLVRSSDTSGTPGENDAAPSTFIVPRDRAVSVKNVDGVTSATDEWPLSLTRGQSRLSSLLAGREPVVFDDFVRHDTESALGLWSSGWRWHNSSNFRILGEAAVLSDDATTNTRYYARSGHILTDHIWQITVEAEGDFNCGWTIRSPDTEFGANPRLYCRFYKSDGEPFFRLSYGESGSSDSAATLLGEAEWPDPGTGKFVFSGIVDGRDLEFYANGELIFRHTITEAQDDALGNNFGINANFGSEGAFRRVEVYRLRDKPPDWPKIFAHRMVVSAPFGTDTWDGRDPENCISALERLPRGIGIEVDIRASSDGDFVLMHDETVDRTTNGTGTVSAMTTAALTALRVKGIGGRNVPTFQELLSLLEDRPDIPEILVDYKAGGITAALDELQQAPQSVYDRCLFFVSSLSDAQTARAYDANVRICVGSRDEENIGELEDLVAAGVEMILTSPADNGYNNNRSIIPTYQAEGIRAGASTTRWHWTMRNVVEDGADHLLADYPLGTYG